MAEHSLVAEGASPASISWPDYLTAACLSCGYCPWSY